MPATLPRPRAGRATNAPNPFLLGAGLAALLGWLASGRDFGPDGYWIPLKGLVVVALGLAPGLVYLYRARADRRSVEPLPYLAVLGLIYALYYGLPVLVRDRVTFMSLEPDPASLSEALDLAIVGWLSLLLGFRVLGPKLFAGHRNRPLRVAWDPARARVLAAALVAVGAAATAASEAFDVPASLTQVVRLLALMLRVGIGIWIVLDLTGSTTRVWRPILWCAVVPAYLLLQLRTGQIGASVRPLVFVLLLVWAYRFRLPWLAIAAIGVTAILLRGAAAEFRTMVWRSSSVAELSPFERSALFFDVAKQDLLSHPAETVEHATELIGSRTAQLALFAHTVKRTPEAVPYWNGTTYQTLASSFVPRFVWRDKPTKELGQRFGHRYAMLQVDDRETSVNLPQLVELFVNFGPLGVGLGMLGIGVLYAFVGLKLNHPLAGEGTTLIGALIYSELVNIESDFSLVFGGLLQTAVVLWLVLRLCAPRASRSRPVRELRPSPAPPRLDPRPRTP